MRIKVIFSIVMVCITFMVVFAQKISFNEGIYYTDATQNRLFSGEHREYYENGALNLEIFIKNGKPKGRMLSISGMENRKK